MHSRQMCTALTNTVSASSRVTPMVIKHAETTRSAIPIRDLLFFKSLVPFSNYQLELIQIILYDLFVTVYISSDERLEYSLA